MNKPTVLEIVQGLLSDMDGDEVNSISDTLEAMQVANTVRQVFYGIVEEFDLQSSETACELQPVSGLPTHMRIPDGVFDVTEVFYGGKVVPFMRRDDFLAASHQYDTSEARFQTVADPSGVSVVVFNNGPPTAWTTLDGAATLVFNGWDSGVEANLQANKSKALGKKKPMFHMDSDATVDLPETLHQLLINEARELCFDLYKDGASRKINELSRRSRVRAKQRNNKVKTPPDNLPDYGRKRRG